MPFLSIYACQRGYFTAERYESSVSQTASGFKAGFKAKILFTPYTTDPGCDVALIQIVRCTLLAGNGQPEEQPYETSLIKASKELLTSNNWHVDAKGRPTPAFGLGLKEGVQGSGDGLWKKTCSEKEFAGPPGSLKSELGFSGGKVTKPAMLFDLPARDARKDRIFHHEFEIGAVCVTGDVGRYLAGLKWGYKGDYTGDAVKVFGDMPSTLDAPSADWKAAGKCWNGTAKVNVPGALD
jgi:hypothetical protein